MNREWEGQQFAQQHKTTTQQKHVLGRYATREPSHTAPSLDMVWWQCSPEIGVPEYSAEGDTAARGLPPTDSL